MKQRITYLRDNQDEFHPDQLQVKKHSMHIKSLKAAKEHRVTVDPEELPSNLVNLLEQSHSLHIRWASPRSYSAIDPFSSRVTPGLHVFFSPNNRSSSPLLCATLKHIFSPHLKCSSLSSTFTTPSSNSTTSPLSHYYTTLPTLDYLVTYFYTSICTSCTTSTTEFLLSAAFFDIEYDSSATTLTLTSFHPPTTWTETITHPNTAHSRIEVGVLNAEAAPEADEMGLGGFLTVLGEDDKASATLFAFPTRHRACPAAFQASFETPTGLHPTLHISLPKGAATTPDIGKMEEGAVARCGLHAYLTLPSALFIDRHAFSDPLFLASQGLKGLKAFSGAMDLEAPDWSVKAWGSTALFELRGGDGETSPADATTDTGLRATIPLHLRYLSPSNSSSAAAPPETKRDGTTPARSGITALTVPPPAVFWACTPLSTSPGKDPTINPFDRLHLGYNDLFPVGTVFYHIPPTPSNATTSTSSSSVMLDLQVPVLNLSPQQHSLFSAAGIEFGTVGAILVGVGWVLWCLFRPVGGAGGIGDGDGKKRGSKVKSG